MKGRFIVDCDDQSERVVIACSGDLDLSTSEAMTLAVKRLDPRIRWIIFDFHYVTFADSAGLAPVATAIKLFGIDRVTIEEPTKIVQRILQFTHLTHTRKCLTRGRPSPLGAIAIPSWPLRHYRDRHTCLFSQG